MKLLARCKVPVWTGSATLFPSSATVTWLAGSNYKSNTPPTWTNRYIYNLRLLFFQDFNFSFVARFGRQQSLVGTKDFNFEFDRRNVQQINETNHIWSNQSRHSTAQARSRMARHACLVVGPDPWLDRSSPRASYDLVGPASYFEPRTDWQDERTHDFVVFEREGRFVVDGEPNYSWNDLKWLIFRW